jgi:hypothetical protein
MSCSVEYGGEKGSPFRLLPQDHVQTVQKLDVRLADHEGSLVAKIELF